MDTQDIMRRLLTLLTPERITALETAIDLFKGNKAQEGIKALLPLLGSIGTQSLDTQRVQPPPPVDWMSIVKIVIESPLGMGTWGDWDTHVTPLLGAIGQLAREQGPNFQPVIGAINALAKQIRRHREKEPLDEFVAQRLAASLANTVKVVTGNA